MNYSKRLYADILYLKSILTLDNDLYEGILFMLKLTDIIISVNSYIL